MSKRISIPSLPLSAHTTDSPIPSAQRAKAHITRWKGRWLVRPLGSSVAVLARDTFLEACDEASFVTLMEMRTAGLR